MKQPRLVIEQGSRGTTYQNDSNTFTVYELSVYSRSSVLAGQQKRTWMNSFTSLAEAQAAYPTAKVSGNTFQPPSLVHLPGTGDGSNDY